MDSNYRGGRGLVANNPTPDFFDNLAAGVLLGPALANAYWNGNGSVNPYVMNSGQVAGDFNAGVIVTNFIGFRFLSGANL